MKQVEIYARVRPAVLIEGRRKQSDVTITTIFADLERSYGEEIDLTVYRCVQEATNNALRHAEPSSILVELKHEGPRSAGGTSSHATLLRLRIIDNGSGMKRFTPIGFGIATMRERVRAVGGEVEIGENWPSGTMVTATILSRGASPSILNRN